jgi:SAM-dependent methyltransferase
MSGPPPGLELLDRHDADPAEVRESLRNIARANRWFGGWWAVRHGLARLTAGLPPGSALTLLDIGTGAGDLPRQAERWACRGGLRLRAFGLERNRTAARVASHTGIPTAVALAGQLPLRAGSVDLVVLSQILHHLAPDAIVRLLSEADRLARLGVVVADLRRARAALAGFWVGSRLLRFDRATRADGLTSVRRGFTPAELAHLLLRAGIRAPVERRPGFRLVAAWRTGAAR